MRRAPLGLLLAFLPVGCFSGSSGNGNNPDANFGGQDAEFADSSGPDTSITPPIDASVETGVDANMPMPDATVVDSAVDAPVEASAGPVTVVVTNAVGPEPGVPVVFQSAAGTVVMPIATGASGTASYLAASGSQVTVVMGSTTEPYLFTVQEVEPGDTIAVYDPSVDATYLGDTISIDSWPDAAPPGTGEYEGIVGANCNEFGNGPPILPQISAGCEAAGHAPVLLEALNGGTIVGYTWQKGVPLPDDGGGSPETVDVNITNPWSTATNTLSLTPSNFPDAAIAGSATATMIVSGLAVPLNGGTDNGTLTGTYSFTYPAGYADAVQTEANEFSLSPSTAAISSIATRMDPAAGDAGLAVDLSTLLPLLASSTLDSTTAAQPIVSWSPADAGALGATQGVLVTLVWSNGAAYGSWTIVTPPTTAQVQAPVLPSAVSGYAPSATSFFRTPPTVALVQATFFTGYQSLRAQAGTAGLTSVILSQLVGSNGGYFSGPIAPPLSENGTLQMTAITHQGD
jgi:hypothetical protein